MVASENYQMDSEIHIEDNISNSECLSDVLSTINYRNREEIMCKKELDDDSSLKNGDILSSNDVMSKIDSETIGELTYQDSVNLAETKLKNKQNSRKPDGTPGPPPAQSKVRRVPSTANPKHRTPLLYKSQRSTSAPQLSSQVRQNHRRQSLPQNVYNAPSVHKNSTNQNSNNSLYQELIRHQLQVQQNGKQSPSNKTTQEPQAVASQYSSSKGQQQQQIIYIQIPNIPPTQNYDSQVLQQQISMQLQQLVPQIYTQLVSQSTVHQSSDLQHSRSKSPSTLSLNSNSSSETISSSKNCQQYPGNSNPDSQSQRKRKNSIESITSNNQAIEVINEALNNIASQNNLTDVPSSNTFAQDNATLLSQQFGSIDIQKSTGIPQLTIPLSQELLLQCQQLRDPVFAAYHPRLETIHEEAMSVKKLAMKTVSKSKIFACILTVLSLIVVVVLAGDRTIAVVVVTVMFLIFFLGLVGFLYLNSSKNSSEACPV